MPLAADAVGTVLSTALDGLAMRQRVIADNIANLDTPGFRATSVDFESALRAAIGGLADGSVTSLERGVAVTSTPTRTPVGANDNNVDLRKESLAALQTQYQFQVVSRAVSDRADLVSRAAAM